MNQEPEEGNKRYLTIVSFLECLCVDRKPTNLDKIMLEENTEADINRISGEKEIRFRYLQELRGRSIVISYIDCELSFLSDSQ